MVTTCITDKVCAEFKDVVYIVVKAVADLPYIADAFH